MERRSILCTSAVCASFFPRLVFIHLFRDVRAVVRSMLNFHRVAGIQLVANEEEAYRVLDPNRQRVSHG